MLTLGKAQRHLYLLDGFQGMRNANQPMEFGLINYEGSIRRWNGLTELGLGVNWAIGEIQLQFGPHFRVALNNFGTNLKNRIEVALDQLQPRELEIKMAILFP